MLAVTNYTRKVKVTGTRSTVLRRTDGVEPKTPWAIRCEEHGTVVTSFPTQHSAWEASKDPRNWCSACSIAHGGNWEEEKPSKKPSKTSGSPTPDAIRAHAEELMAKHEVNYVPLQMDKRSLRRLGAVKFRKYSGQPVALTLSVKAMKHMSWEDITDTILHEIAHIIAGAGEGHGPKWKAAARRVGAVPKSCKDANIPPEAFPHEATCEKCGVRTGFSRMTPHWKAELMTHKKCGGRFRVNR